MGENYDVFLFEDHQIVIDSFHSAFKIIQERNGNINFNFRQAQCCKQAWNLISQISNSNGNKIFLIDIKLKPDHKNKLYSGEDLGVKIKACFPKSKVIICTSLNQNNRILNIVKQVNPDSLIIKSDIDFNELVLSINKVIQNETYYSKTVINLLRKRTIFPFVLDIYDTQILMELAQGARMKELQELIPLSKTAIEKRKRQLKIYFKVDTDSDRELVKAARENGFL